MNFTLKLKCFANIYTIFHHAYEKCRCSMAFYGFPCTADWSKSIRKINTPEAHITSDLMDSNWTRFDLHIDVRMLSAWMWCDRFCSPFLVITFGKVGLMNVSPLVICSFFPLPLFFLCSAFYMTWSEWELNAIIRFVWLNELERA